MDTSPIDDCHQQAASEPAEAEPSSAEHAKLQQQRIRQLRTESLAKSDPLAANLGVFTADMLEMAVPLKDAIIKATQTPGNADRLLRRSSAGLDAFLRLMGQVGRFTNLEIRLARKPGT